jgi:hypothetical protein
MKLNQAFLILSKRHKEEMDDWTKEGGMNRLSKRKSIESLESVTRRPIGRMDQLSNPCEGDEKLCSQTFGLGVAVLVNEILKPYYRWFVSPRFPKIWILGWKMNVYFEDVDHLDFHLVRLWE